MNEPGNGDQSRTSPRPGSKQEKRRPPPFQLPPNGPLGSGTDPRKNYVQKKTPLTSIKTGTQKHKACGAYTTTKKKGEKLTRRLRTRQERRAAPSYILSQS